MTTYVDVALEEIRKDYPKAYEILKDAVIPDYVPYITETRVGALSYDMMIVKTPNTPQLIINCPEVNEIISKFSGVVSGNLNVGSNSYHFDNIFKSGHSSEHQLILELEKITKE